MFNVWKMRESTCNSYSLRLFFRASGIVCLWNLNSKSRLLVGTDVSRDGAGGSTGGSTGGSAVIRPFRVIQAHVNAVKGVRFCQQNPRFFCTVSADR